jgi:hypothetical protein
VKVGARFARNASTASLVVGGLAEPGLQPRLEGEGVGSESVAADASTVFTAR